MFQSESLETHYTPGAVRWRPIEGMFFRGLFWIRLFGWGFRWKRVSVHPLTVSDRWGEGWHVVGWHIRWLRP